MHGQDRHLVVVAESAQGFDVRLTGSVQTMTSTPSYPRRPAISKAVAVDSG
ncbi:hypothetical protein SFUMM280S_00795 [Streptomyces fumanus]